MVLKSANAMNKNWLCECSLVVARVHEMAQQFSSIRPLARLRAAYRRQYDINYSNNNHKNKTYFAYKLLHRWNTLWNANGAVDDVCLVVPFPTTTFEKCMRMQLGGARHLHKYSAVYFCLEIPQSTCWNVREKMKKRNNFNKCTIEHEP